MDQAITRIVIDPNLQVNRKRKFGKYYCVYNLYNTSELYTIIITTFSKSLEI